MKTFGDTDIIDLKKFYPELIEAHNKYVKKHYRWGGKKRRIKALKVGEEEGLG